MAPGRAAGRTRAKVRPRRTEARVSTAGIAGGWSCAPSLVRLAAPRGPWPPLLFVRYDLVRTEGFDHNASTRRRHRLLAGGRVAVALSAPEALAGRDGSCRARPDRSPRRCR